MKNRHSAEQIVVKLRQADVALGKGLRVPEVCKELGISDQTHFRSRQVGFGRSGLLSDPKGRTSRVCRLVSD